MEKHNRNYYFAILIGCRPQHFHAIRRHLSCFRFGWSPIPLTQHKRIIPQTRLRGDTQAQQQYTNQPESYFHFISSSFH